WQRTGVSGRADRTADRHILWRHSGLTGPHRLRTPRQAAHRNARRPPPCLQGRLHAYEGHPAQAIAVPIRILRRLGVARLILTNAAGGVNPKFTAGTLML